MTNNNDTVLRARRMGNHDGISRYLECPVSSSDYEIKKMFRKLSSFKKGHFQNWYLYFVKIILIVPVNICIINFLSNLPSWLTNFISEASPDLQILPPVSVIN